LKKNKDLKIMIQDPNRRRLIPSALLNSILGMGLIDPSPGRHRDAEGGGIYLLLGCS